MAIGEFGTIINQAQVASFAHIHPPIKVYDNIWLIQNTSSPNQFRDGL